MSKKEYNDWLDLFNKIEDDNENKKDVQALLESLDKVKIQLMSDAVISNDVFTTLNSLANQVEETIEYVKTCDIPKDIKDTIIEKLS